MIDDLKNADEIFITGTFAGVIPAIKVDDGLINSGKIGKLTSTLFKLYNQKIEDKYSNE